MAGNKRSKNFPETSVQASRDPAPVYISHALQDASIANTLVKSLEQQGIRCWAAPRDATPRLQDREELAGVINDAAVVILVLSQHAIASAHVGREIERAASKRRRIIVLRTDATPLTRSFEYFLRESQWVEVAALGVTASLAKVTQAVGQRVAGSSWVSPGLGRDATNPSERKLRPSYLTIRRSVLAALFLLGAALVVGVVVRYWPSSQSATVDRAVTR